MSIPIEGKLATFESLPAGVEPLFTEFLADGSASTTEAWRIARRDARKKIRKLRSDLSKAPMRMPVDTLRAWRVGIAAAKFDIWAERNLIIVRTDEGIHYYQKWLRNYAAA